MLSSLEVLFNSWDFWLAFVPLYAVYLRLGRLPQNRLLLAFSVAFYGYWDWRFLGLLWWSTIEDYFCALRIHAATDPRTRRAYLALSIATNVGLLALFKYFGFFVGSLASALAGLGFQASLPVLEMLVPVGLSFYTFQTLGYTLDVYRGRCEPVRDFLDFALFVSFFPQLIAGPIEKASKLMPQLQSERRVTLEHVAKGLWLCFWGLFQKCVVADNLAAFVDPAYAPGADPSPGEAWLAFYAFPLQIYCDFSGYSDMARGLASLLGIELSVNFRLPFFAADWRELWQRWHITLWDWFRDNVYAPLGVARGRWTRRRNIAIVFVLAGLWHGAGWNYVLWGAYCAVVAVIEDMLRPPPPRGPWERAWRAALTFHVFAVSAIVFRAPSLEAGRAVTVAAFSGLPDFPAGVGLAVLAVAPVLLVELLRWPDRDAEDLLARPTALKTPVYAALAAWFIWLAVDRSKEYVYFHF